MTTRQGLLDDQTPFGSLVRAMAEGMAPAPAGRQLELSLEAPTKRSTPQRAHTSRREPRLLERLDQWFWRQRQREREAYLAQATDIQDLEMRMKALDRGIDPRLV
jgi:hypothetical protein